ncbi:MAG TPA: hypothetical protein VN258_03000 [Mobilitalea sp.]|nr:hypothetical protein [Mobilitalea sp.]
MIKMLSKLGKRRLIGMIFGNILLGIGVSVFKLSGMGNDLFSAMIMSVSALFHLSYSNFLVILNSFIFIIEITLGRKYIGLGTVVNWFLVGYVAEFFIWLENNTIAPPEAFLVRLPFVVAGVIIISFGVSLYQTSDAGIAPYDSVSLIMKERLPIPYFWCRMICDGSCAVIALLTGGLIGLGTFACAFCLGPVIHFFNIKLSKKILYKQA